jgi:hypothetical protein
MGFFSSIKKLFGFGEQETNSSLGQLVVVEPIQEAQVVEEPVYVKVETPVVVETVVEQTTETQSNTVGEIKSKSRRQQPKSSDDTSSQKPRKPYRRPRPKKEKPSE